MFWWLENIITKTLILAVECFFDSLSLYSAAVTRDIEMIKMSVVATHNSNLSKNIFITPPAIISLPRSC